MDTKECRIESETEIDAYLARLRYALDSGARIEFQEIRRVDENREEKYTNKYTVASFSEEVFPYRKESAA